MSELLRTLHEVGKIDNDTVKNVSNFITQNQLHNAPVDSSNTVSIAVQFSIRCWLISKYMCTQWCHKYLATVLTYKCTKCSTVFKVKVQVPEILSILSTYEY